MKILQDPKALLLHQVKNLYVGECNEEAIDKALPIVLDKLDNCFSHISNKYYCDGGETIFNPLHVCQWTMFLYDMAKEISTLGDTELSDKLYGLSKCFSSADLYYGVNLPEIWFFDHPQGSVMGRATYGNYFSFSQGCTVGNNKGIYPVFGEHVSLMSDAKILGNCHVGDYVIFSANSFVMDTDIPCESIVFGSGKDLVIKPYSKEKVLELTKAWFRF